jgi:hypothetical protein
MSKTARSTHERRLRRTRTRREFIAITLLAGVMAFFAGGAQAQNTEWRSTALGVQEARGLFICKTRISFTSGHGTQVTYMHPNGAVFLWYPGNTVVLPGKWQIVPSGSRPQSEGQYADICFQYGSNTYNPVTGRPGGKWECRPAHTLEHSTVDRTDGDVFGLATRTAVPFRLTRERTTIAELRKHLRSLGLKETRSGSSADEGCTKGEVKLDRMRHG